MKIVYLEKFDLLKNIYYVYVRLCEEYVYLTG